MFFFSNYISGMSNIERRAEMHLERKEFLVNGVTQQDREKKEE